MSMNTIRELSAAALPSPTDLQVFTVVVRKSSFTGAAAELGVSPAYISKRIQVLEAVLGTRLLHRTTRRVAMTADGEQAYESAGSILADLGALADQVSSARQVPRGQLHIASTFGFGRNFVAPAISELSDRYPNLQVRLDVLDRQVDLVAEGFDIDIHQATVPPTQHIARKLVSNRRILCASPKYLEAAGTPRNLADLSAHNCLVIKVREHPFGVWTLKRGKSEEVVRVAGKLSSNSGEVVMQWGLDGREILLRSTWGVQTLLDTGQLIHILPEYWQDSHVWAVYPTRLSSSAKLRVCVEFLADYFARHLPAA